MVFSGPYTDTVVPSYPYNVSMIPQTHNGVTPDDSGINTHLPSICVDYLSHEWAESDVWASWKAMTRHKAEIANGVRLENASWRTWAKQRGKLKTISPETLNWLKDSDVTWLYGPLHTGIEAVPPPKVATTSDRLGLEPLRSLSDARTEKAAAAATSKRGKKPVLKTKPILKYRSLSDILMPVGTPASPILEYQSMDFDSDSAATSSSTVLQSRSESNLSRMSSAIRRKRNPSSSPRGTSPEAVAHASDSSSSRNGDRRHISFNHRVEQCIAVDSTEEAHKYTSTTTGSSSDDDGDDEDDVLTFRSSSPRVASFGPSAMSAAHARHSSDRGEPHTIARLGPTTLKSTELYPAPSPAVVYHQTALAAPEVSSTGRSNYPSQPVATYSARTTPQPQVARGRRGVYEYSNPVANGLNSQWDPDEEDDYAMGFDYFNGPDVGVGDEYDMVQYGSQHLVGTSHNHYQGGNTPSYHASTYPGVYSSSPAQSNSPTSTDSSPNHSRRSSNNTNTPTSVSPSPPTSTTRGPHSPASTSKDAASPKRSILKGGRSRESSAEVPIPTASSSSSSLRVNSSPTFASPPGSGRVSPVPSSPQISGKAGMRRTASEEVFRERESRGRSTSRGSSSSLERSASADRRGSISPTASYASIVAVGASARPIGIPGSRRGGSSDSLNTLVGQIGRPMPDLPEASSESETETVRATGNQDEPSSASISNVVLPSSLSKESVGAEIETVEDSEMPSVEPPMRISNMQATRPPPPPIEPSPPPASATPPHVVPPSSSVVTAEVVTVEVALATAMASPSPSPSPQAPRYRQPSPSSPSAAATSTTVARGSESPSLPADSFALDPSEVQGSDETPAPSHARRSLLRAARASSLGGSGSERDDSTSRASVDSGRSGHDDYGFGLYDEEADSGIVGTARDLLGAITKGIWNIGRR